MEEPFTSETFVRRAKLAYAIVATGEIGLYGNIILKKGAINPDSK
jgi:L-fucose mutarotase